MIKVFFLNMILLFSFNSTLTTIYDIKCYKKTNNLSIYLYQDMKEVRYLYIDNLVEVDLENIEIYAGLNKVEFITLADYINVIDLNNYYPIDCLKFNIINDTFDNFNMNIKISNKLNFDLSEFAHGNFIIKPKSKISITIKDFIMTNPEWKPPKISNKKIEENYTKKMLEKVEIK